MESFGRGCLYIIVGIIVLVLIAFFIGGTLTIPWYILIPLIILAFWAASKRSK
ncbi:hypothetical protein [Paenibacillus kobensis]|uniref:hypothetical protein n=1 Tax=Paenibacillus kobensis TaxID=59841 RepID=UPI0013E3AAA9|nr:hypothetical protein [Paenibacillus kobensis]